MLTSIHSPHSLHFDQLSAGWKFQRLEKSSPTLARVEEVFRLQIVRIYGAQDQLFKTIKEGSDATCETLLDRDALIGFVVYKQMNKQEQQGQTNIFKVIRMMILEKEGRSIETHGSLLINRVFNLAQKHLASTVHILVADRDQKTISYLDQNGFSTAAGESDPTEEPKTRVMYAPIPEKRRAADPFAEHSVNPLPSKQQEERIQKQGSIRKEGAQKIAEPKQSRDEVPASGEKPPQSHLQSEEIARSSILQPHVSSSPHQAFVQHDAPSIHLSTAQKPLRRSSLDTQHEKPKEMTLLASERGRKRTREEDEGQSSFFDKTPASKKREFEFHPQTERMSRPPASFFSAGSQGETPKVETRSRPPLRSASAPFVPKVTTHEITLRKKYIEQIRSGKKTIEGRIHNGIILRYKPGDTVRFFCQQDAVQCEILAIRRYGSFRELLEKEGFRNCLADVHNLQEAIQLYNEIPGYAARAAQYGVVAIHVRPTTGAR